MSFDIIKKYFLNVGVSYYNSKDCKYRGYSYVPIGNYGIGFLACFMLSNNVQIKSKRFDSADTIIVDIEKDKISDIVNSFEGTYMQEVPKYSAVKVNGKKLYEYARQGQAVEIKPRDIEIYSISLKAYKDDEIMFETECSKGTYIRVLCEDIAKELGTVGYMKELQRTAVDKFKIEQSIDLENLNKEIAEKNLITIENIFDDKDKIELNDRKLELFLNGVQLTHELEDNTYRIYNKNKFIGLGIVKNNLLKRDIVI